jgi:DHA1 family bicyclomycin/chloramphenicol resistance-like MFS transporter
MTSVCGFVATDIFLPAVPALTQAYGRSASDIQALFSVFLYTLAASQLLHGPISDATGRRIPMLVSLGAYSIGSLAIPYCAGFEAVLVWRAVQAVGACGAIVIGRAIAADVHQGASLTRFFLSVSIVVGMSPAIAPVLGQQLYSGFGWKACFLFTAGFGAALWIAVYLGLPETRKRPAVTSSWTDTALRGYGAVLRSPAFRLHAATIAVSQAAYFAYLSESAFLLLGQGLAPGWLGYAYVSLSIAYVAGNLTARALAARLDAPRVYRYGHALFLGAAVSMGVGMVSWPASTQVMLGGISALTFANGFLLPLGTAAAIAAVPSHSASAAGLSGFFQLLCAGLAAQMIGPLTAHQPAGFGCVMLVIGLASLGLGAVHRKLYP